MPSSPSNFEDPQSYIKKLRQDIVVITAKIKPTWQGQRPAKVTNNDNYCWSHGYQIHKDHISALYKATKEGHKTEATKSNIMGGFKWGKE
jgi:hypothetical protein